MGKIVNRVGEVKKANNGLMMRIIAYRSRRDIDIEFEDGVIVYHRRYDNFILGSIKHPNVKNLNQVNAGFQHKSNLSNNNISSRNTEAKRKYMGMIKTMNNGRSAKLINYIDWGNISVEFDDGTIVTQRTMSSFLNGQISNPNYNVFDKKKEIGTVKISKCGFKVKLVEYIDAKTKCKVLFEDGILKEMWYCGFQQGKIIHPGFNRARGKCSSSKYLNFTDLNESFNSNGRVFYFCKDSNGAGDLLTPQQMMEKSGVKKVF